MINMLKGGIANYVVYHPQERSSLTIGEIAHVTELASNTVIGYKRMKEYIGIMAEILNIKICILYMDAEEIHEVIGLPNKNNFTDPIQLIATDKTIFIGEFPSYSIFNNLEVSNYWGIQEDRTQLDSLGIRQNQTESTTTPTTEIQNTLIESNNVPYNMRVSQLERESNRVIMGSNATGTTEDLGDQGMDVHSQMINNWSHTSTQYIYIYICII